VILGTLEPVAARWDYDHGRRGVKPLPPLPPALRERAGRNHCYLSLVRYGLLCLSLWYLMIKNGVPAVLPGLHLRHWLALLAIGLLTGTVILATQRVARTIAAELTQRPVPYRRLEYLTRGSAALWILSTLLGCFGEEFWRALSIVNLQRAGHSAAFGLAATAVVFALPHYESGHSSAFKFGYLFKTALDGVLYGLVFLLFRSIVPTYTGHLLVNLVALHRARQSETSPL
jgi:hypothetical protein